MGLFGVNMPPLYEEGLECAFPQVTAGNHDSVERSHDICLDQRPCIWRRVASTVRCFHDSGRYRARNYSSWSGDLKISVPKSDYAMTNVGLHIQVPLLPIPKHFNMFIALLACKMHEQDEMVAVFLRKQKSNWFNAFTRVSVSNRSVYSISMRKVPQSLVTPEYPVMWISVENPKPCGRLHKKSY
jgi:hypothetical protein